MVGAPGAVIGAVSGRGAMPPGPPDLERSRGSGAPPLAPPLWGQCRAPDRTATAAARPPASRLVREDAVPPREAPVRPSCYSADGCCLMMPETAGEARGGGARGRESGGPRLPAPPLWERSRARGQTATAGLPRISSHPARAVGTLPPGAPARPCCYFAGGSKSCSMVVPREAGVCQPLNLPGATPRPVAPGGMPSWTGAAHGPLLLSSEHSC